MERDQALPFDLMWSDAATWIPDVLAGHAITGTVVYGDDNEAMVSHDLRRAGPIGPHPKHALTPANPDKPGRMPPDVRAVCMFPAMPPPRRCAIWPDPDAGLPSREYRE